METLERIMSDLSHIPKGATMNIEDRPTPETDALPKHYQYRSLCSGLIYADSYAAGNSEAIKYVQIKDARRFEQQRDALREALECVLGPRDDENIGWRRHSGDPNKFTCEFCLESHEDSVAISHKADCPVTTARAVLEATKPLGPVPRTGNQAV